MIHDTHEFYFEDFVTDISNYLHEQQDSFLEYGFYETTTINKNKLAIKLAEFWQNNFKDD